MKSPLFLVLLLFITAVYALDCQYQETKLFSQDGEWLYINGTETIIGPPLNLTDFQEGGGDIVNKCHYSFKVTNPLSEDIMVRIIYPSFRPANMVQAEGKEEHIINLSLGRYASKTISGEMDGIGKCYVLRNEVSYSVFSPDVLVLRRGTLQTNKIVCKQCGGVNCLDDGFSCKMSRDCGGGYCVRGICNNESKCFRGDCACAETELQCGDNRCVERNSTPIGISPSCGLAQECVTKFINNSSGLCASVPQPPPIPKPINWPLLIILGLIILFGGVGTIFFLINKGKDKDILAKEQEISHEKERQKTIQKEIELEGRKIQTKELQLTQLKAQIQEIERQKNQTTQEIRGLENLKQRRAKLISDIEVQYQKVTKPFPDAQVGNRFVIVNPYLGGYKCFFEKGLAIEDYPISKLIHRWVWKKHNGRYPKPGYHIHHVDGDKYNNDPRNLEEISGVEHYAKYHNG